MEKWRWKKVPKIWFKIEGLNIAGFDRGIFLANVNLPFKMISSLLKARKIIKRIPTRFCGWNRRFCKWIRFIHRCENGNSYFYSRAEFSPGKTNIFNAKKQKLFHCLSEYGKILPRNENVIFRKSYQKNIITDIIDSDLAKEKIRFRKGKLTILSVGGSLGSRTLNNGWKENINQVLEKDYQLIWQTGKLDYKNILEETKDIHSRNIQIVEFIKNMEMAYSAADVIVSRAGAIMISGISHC